MTTRTPKTIRTIFAQRGMESSSRLPAAILAVLGDGGKFLRGNAAARDADTGSPVRLYYWPMSATAARGYAPSEEEQRAGGERPARPLGSAWDWPQTGIWSGVLVLLRGPAPPPGWPAGPFFPDLWIRGGANWELICLSALLHILLILFPIRMRFLSHGAGATPESNASVAW